MPASRQSLSATPTSLISTIRVAVGVPNGGQASAATLDALGQARRTLLDAGATDAGDPPDWLARSRDLTERYWSRAHRTGQQVDRDLADWDDFRTRSLDQTSDVDVIVTPTVPHSAPVHRHMTVDDYLYCLPPSLTGAPAISIPLANGSVQVVARRWEDHVAVAVARKLAFAQSAW